MAAEDAVFLSGLCERVYLVHRRDALRADQALQEKVFACENIEMVWDSVPLEILGQDEVTGLKIRNIKTNEERELTADGVFIAVGIVPNTTLVKDQALCAISLIVAIICPPEIFLCGSHCIGSV